MLTRKQYELLMFIHERIRESGIPPSFDEMKEALDLKSKSGIHRLITALEERGFLRRMEKRARALEVLKLPENMAETLRPATTRSQVQRAGSRHGRSEIRLADARSPAPRRSFSEGGESAVNVPLVGRIAAGTPIEALQNKVSDIPVPGGMVVHMDLYRLRGTEELQALALADLLPGSRLWLIEWPERAEHGLPRADAQIRLEVYGAGRRAHLEAFSERGQSWLRILCADSGS